MARITVKMGECISTEGGNSLFTTGLSDCVAIALVAASGRKVMYHITGANGEYASYFYRLNDAAAAGVRKMIIIYGTINGEYGRVMFKNQDLVRNLIDIAGEDNLIELQSNSVEVYPNGSYALGIE